MSVKPDSVLLSSYLQSPVGFIVSCYLRVASQEDGFIVTAPVTDCSA